MKKFILLLLFCLPLNSQTPISQGKALLEWNKEKLTHRANLTISDIQTLFAPEFTIIANGRKYEATPTTYLEFLNTFRSTIDTIDYEVQEYLSTDSAIIMPLKATVQRLQGTTDTFHAILLLKFNPSGQITHWQEVYSLTASTTP